jgi:hypothetical protein
MVEEPLCGLARLMDERRLVTRERVTALCGTDGLAVDLSHCDR